MVEMNPSPPMDEVSARSSSTFLEDNANAVHPCSGIEISRRRYTEVPVWYLGLSTERLLTPHRSFLDGLIGAVVKV